jgi:hypothetical protein
VPAAGPAAPSAGHRAVRQADAEGHGDQCHRQRSEHLQDQRRQERHPQRPHGGLPVPVRHHSHPLDLGLGPAEQPEGRQARDDVEEPPGEALEGVPLRGGVLLGGAPMSTMNSGISGTTMARIRADSRSAPRIRRPAASGTTTARTSPGRYDRTQGSRASSAVPVSEPTWAGPRCGRWSGRRCGQAGRGPGGGRSAGGEQCPGGRSLGQPGGDGPDRSHRHQPGDERAGRQRRRRG